MRLATDSGMESGLCLCAYYLLCSHGASGTAPFSLWTKDVKTKYKTRIETLGKLLSVILNEITYKDLLNKALDLHFN